MGDLKGLSGSAIAVLTLAAIVLTALAIVTGFKNTGLVDNTTANAFVTGLAIFGSFVGVLVLGIVGKAIIGLFSKK